MKEKNCANVIGFLIFAVGIALCLFYFFVVKQTPQVTMDAFTRMF